MALDFKIQAGSQLEALDHLVVSIRQSDGSTHETTIAKADLTDGGMSKVFDGLPAGETVVTVMAMDARGTVLARSNDVRVHRTTDE